MRLAPTASAHGAQLDAPVESWPDSGMAIGIQRRRLSVAEWDRIIASGALPEDDRVELIDGEILQMSPIGPRHAACVGRLTSALAAALANNLILWVQNPVTIADFDEPQADVALLRSRDDGYAAARPSATDILLLVEVADTSFDYDLGVKIPRYAAAGVQEAWLVDLNGNRVLVCRRPRDGAYQDVQIATPPVVLVPEVLPDLRVPVTSIV